MKRILITGGAGFIGSHLTDELVRCGYVVRVLDSLEAQVHGSGCKRPDYFHRDAELQVGDLRNRTLLRRALQGIEGVVHLASAVGVGQSMYQIARYTSVNSVGTALLLEELIERPVAKLVVASSMSIYGEGAYVDSEGHQRRGSRSPTDLAAGRWECRDTQGRPLVPIPTPETKRPVLNSIYAQTKFDQERMSLIVGESYRIPTTALRFFNVYGPRQALSNPYTGVLAIFGARVLNGRSPVVFEDGLQRRDFVHVRDVARACRLALENPRSNGHAINIGSGEGYSIRDIARRIAAALGRPDIEPEVTGKFRAGDIRHCYSDIRQAQTMLRYQPLVPLQEGLEELANWMLPQKADDLVEVACRELSSRGLTN